MMFYRIFHFLNRLVVLDKSKLVILLSLFLWNCDSGCVSADSIGSADVASVDVDADPAEYISYTDPANPTPGTEVIKPYIGYDYLSVYDAGGPDEMCYSIWRQMNLSYNDSYDYSIGYSGTVESCSDVSSIPYSVEAMFTADMVNGVDMSSSVDGDNISAFNAAFSTSSNYNFAINAALSGNSFNCLGEKVITYEHFGGVFSGFGGVFSGSNYYTSSSGKNDSLGNTNSYTCSNQSGCALNTSFSDISGLEIPRGCTVTFYDKTNGPTDGNAAGVTVSVPLFAPSPYAYNLSDYRFDSTGLESQCDQRAADDCTTSLSVVQDSSSYETCDNSKTSYLWKHAMYGNEMRISGLQGFATLSNVTYSGSNPGNDEASSAAVMEGCKLTLYDSSTSSSYPTPLVWPDIRALDSEVFMPNFLCTLADKSSWGYEVSLDANAVNKCSNENYFGDNIKSMYIVPNPVYENLAVMANTYPTSEDYKPEFYQIRQMASNSGALFFDGKSNFMISNNIANYIRSNLTYTMRLSISPFCDDASFTSDTSDDCSAISAEDPLQPRIIFASNQDNQDDLGDYLSIGPDGILEFNGYDLGSTSYYNKRVDIVIKRGSGSADINLLNADTGDVEVFTISTGTSNNRRVEYFSLGQEWDYVNAASQFYLGYLYNFTLLSSTATDEDLDAVASVLGATNIIYSSGGSSASVSDPICRDDFGLNDIQIGYGTDLYTDFTVVTDDIVLDGVFQIPTGIENGDSFFFRVKNTELLCTDDINTALDIYTKKSGVITISVKEEKDSKGLVTGLQKYIVDPIVDIFECKDEDSAGNPANCAGFYKMFYDQIVIGTPGHPSLFSVLLNLTLQFMVIMMGINFMFGLEKMSAWALLSRIFKIGIVYLLVSPESWDFFRDNVIVFVRDVPLQIGEFLTDNLALSENIASSSQEKASMFDMLDNITGIFLSSDVHAKIWALLFTSPPGIFMVALLYYSIFIFFKAVIAALVQYVVIILLISLAIILAPFFIMFALMPFTAQFFGKWLDMLIGCAFKLMLLSLTVIIFSYFIYAYSYNMFNYAVCWKAVLYCCTFLPFQFSLLEFFAPATFDYRRFGIEEVTASGPDFIEVLSFFIIVMLFYKFLDISEAISSKLAKGTSIAGVAKDFNSAMVSMPKSAANFADSVAGKAYNYAANDPNAYSRMKTNVKRDVYDKTLGALDNKLTGRITNEKKRAAAAMDGLFTQVESEYTKDGTKDTKNFDKDMERKARESLKEFKLSDKEIDKVINSDKFKRKAGKASANIKKKKGS